jgi:uncharacterized protein HemX
MSKTKQSTTNQFNYLVLGILILAIIATFGIYQKTISLEAHVAAQNIAINSLTKHLAAQEEKFKTHKTDITQLHTVTKKLTSSSNEASFAIQMAIYELDLLQNYDAAIEYLNLAQLHTEDLDIEKQISSAIATLKKIPHYNIIAKLDDLDHIKAKLVTLDTTTAKTKKTQLELPENNKALSFLNNFVTISYTDPAGLKLLNPKQQYMLEANMLALINQTKSALTNKNTALFHGSIEKLNSLLALHFALNNQIKAITAELAALDKLELNPSTPDLQAILNTIYSNMKKDSAPAQRIKKGTKPAAIPEITPETTGPHITAEF